jgi:hypothetical protein
MGMAFRSPPAATSVAIGPTLRPAPESVTPPPAHERLPVHSTPPPVPPPGGPAPRWWWLGVHGGAGVSTLMRLIPGGADAARAWPDPRWSGPVGVLLVCRANLIGLTAVSTALRQWMAGLTPPVTVWGLVTVADAPGRTPRSLRSHRARITGAVQRSWFVPWVPAWRTAPADAATAPPVIAQMGRDLRSQPWIIQKGQ